jgi:hypothetical protein
MARDPENATIAHEFLCKGVPETIFTQQFVQNTLSIGLNTESTEL